MVLLSEIRSFAEDVLGAKVHSGQSDFVLDGVVPVSSLANGKIAFCKNVDVILPVNATQLDRSLLIVPEEGRLPDSPCIVAKNPRLAFARVVTQFFGDRASPGIHKTALVSESAAIHATASVGPFCVIGENVKIGADTVLHNHVAVTDNVHIGSDCVLWSHCVIGEDGFGVEKFDDGTLFRLPHIGGVRIGDRVHIGNFSTVASGTIEPTLIDNGAMIDNLVHIAHNAHIGENCQIIACAEISGSVKVGRNAWIAPNAAIIQKVEIGENSIIGLGAAVTQSIPANVVAAGVPAKVIRKV